jgi:glucosamine--fructose-6-phosphate aminotransferase (isomerizing)
MCGIVGYVGDRDAAPILLDCLKRVDYRGYDSCGVALQGESATLEVAKGLGSVEYLQEPASGLPGRVGIGHTRWATIGAPSKENAHPHTDCTGRIAVVHNGEIGNYDTLRERLLAEGHIFRSETDSEVIAHLVESCKQSDLARAVSDATQKLEGSYALGVVAADFPGLVVTRNESPLVVGLGDGENFVASDIPGLLQYTNKTMPLWDGDLAVLTRDGVEVFHDRELVQRPVQKVTWTPSQLDKSGYAHFLLKEIHEQPRVIRDTLAGRLSLMEPTVRLDLKTEGPPAGLVLLGCGTSYHACLIGEHFISPLVDFPVQAKVASEFEPGPRQLVGSWVVALTQSGETADTIAAVKRARLAGAWTLGVTNALESSISQSVDDLLVHHAGPEVSVAATKTFIAQLTVVYLLGMHLAPPLGRLQNLASELRSIPATVQRLLNDESHIELVAKRLSSRSSLFIIARGVNYPVALEGDLKLKEVAYIHAEGYPAGELKHGPFALLGQDTPVIAIVGRDSHYQRMLTAIREVKARGSPVIAVVPSGDEDVVRLADEVITVPPVDPLLSPFVNTVVMQLLAYYVARERGCPIDKPRHLAKSVTVP